MIRPSAHFTLNTFALPARLNRDAEPAAASPKPAGVIAVDPLRADYLVRFRPHFGKSGPKRLLVGVTDFKTPTITAASRSLPKPVDDNQATISPKIYDTSDQLAFHHRGVGQIFPAHPPGAAGHACLAQRQRLPAIFEHRLGRWRLHPQDAVTGAEA